ncbi:MAG: hypothetical protein LC737_09980, partial [Chloroflexi bacterium]|nr:hypothetical protein [Chloroflexota bacterium]
AKRVFAALLHPDLIERDTVTQSGRTTFWVPCADPPQPLPPSGGQFALSAEQSCGTVGDPVTVRGENFPPGAVGNLYWVELNGGNQAQVREAGQAMLVQVGADGKFTQSFHVPAFAGREGIDPNKPLEQGIEVRFVQEVGQPRASENFGDIIGRITDGPPPGVLVVLGVSRATDKFPNVVPGKLAETIALGLMATIFSVVFALPLSFFAAHNITARLPFGAAVYYGMRMFLNVVRAIDTVIWGLIVIVWIGLGPFAGMVALLIHSTAALSKLYSEEIEHIDPGPIEAITASGANLLQVIVCGGAVGSGNRDRQRGLHQREVARAYSRRRDARGADAEAVL